MKPDVKAPIAPSISIRKLILAIKKLPEDAPRDRKGVWYRTQKEHWLGWLSEYHGPGAYGRIGRGKDARFAYNHIVEVDMLLWIIKAAGMKPERVKAAQHAAKNGKTLMAKSGAVRKQVPWDDLAQALWRKPRAD